jgi:hypothetical protein
MPSLRDAGGNALQRQTRRAQLQKDNLDAITGLLPLAQPINITHAAQSALKGKVQTIPCQPI